MYSAIVSNRVITEQGLGRRVVIIKDGKIRGLEKELPDAEIKLTDIADDLLMPGIIDPHVHINEPGRTEWEGFDTATRAAMAGGITSLVEMPLNASPVTTTAEAFRKKKKAAKENLHVNCGFWGGIIPGNEKEIEPLAKEGALGFKAFLTDSGIAEFPAVTEQDLRKAMPLIAELRLPLLVHCELSGPVNKPEGMAGSYQHYLRSRPRQWENDAIELLIKLCGEFNCRTHIVHLSSADSLDAIRKAKEKGWPLTVETAQHYLYFTAEEIPDGRPEFKCAPPIRERENNKRLWAALKEGLIDFVATDHSPAPPELKQMDSGDLMKAWGGISSLQLALPALWSAARRNGCIAEDLCKWLCEAPARLAGLKYKGKLAIGMDADLMCWSPETSFIVDPVQLLHRHKLTPYAGAQLYGLVNKTWLNGKLIYDNRGPDTQGNCLILNKGEMLKNG